MNNQIKIDLKNKRFTSLEFLSSEESWAEDSDNLGLYYFVLVRKGLDTSDVFKKILELNKSYALTYSYLGDVARKLYPEPHEQSTARYYFIKSLKHDENDAHTLWSLYRITRELSYFLAAIKSNYEDKNFVKVSYNLLYVYDIHLIEAKLERADWLRLKEICLDDNVNNYEDVLLISNYHLKDYKTIVDIMDKMEFVNKNIVNLYLGKGVINKEYAFQKLDVVERFNNIKGGAKLLYEESKRENENSKVGIAYPSDGALIRYAFEAEEYQDVIYLIDKYVSQPSLMKISIEQKLHHIISSLYVGNDINKEYEIAVNRENFFRQSGFNSNCKPLYLAYLILRNVEQLEKLIDDHGKDTKIGGWALYKEAKEYLGDESLLNHYIHDSLIVMLKSIKDKWNLRADNYQISELECIVDPLTETESINLSNYLINTKRYEDAISRLIELEPSMQVNNMLGVCYENRGKVDLALKHYKLAVDSMKSSGEVNHIIITNYLSCLDNSEHIITADLYNGYIEDFNRGLASGFRYSLFTPQNSSSLFKYYPFNQFTLDALVNGYFYLASSEQLNDPIELPFDNLITNKRNSLLRPYFRLASLSNNMNSMLMWSHYAENHSGIMVEYCFSGDLPDGVGIEKVNYTHTTKRYKEKDKYLFNQYMLTKNEDWSYEKEVRLFAYKRDKIYYANASYPNQRDDEANVYIKSITVGYKFPGSTIKLIQSIIVGLSEGRDKTLPEIKLSRAKLSEKNFFELEYEVIN